jgi:hypothetical protein
VNDGDIVFSFGLIGFRILSGRHPTAVDDLPYNYVPTEWVCITFVVLFSLLTSKLLSDRISFYALNQLTTLISLS